MSGSRNSISKSTAKRPFYGWLIACLGALGNAVQGGIIFWSMGMYISAFEDEFAEPRAKITLIETFVIVGSNILSPIIGIVVDRWSARYSMAIGALSVGLGLVVCSMAGTLMTVWVAFILFVPLGVVSIGVLPGSAVISRWFRKRRSLALGISVTGSSLGGILVPPVLTFLFMSYGWRTGMLSVGLFAIMLAPVLFFLVADYPEDRGLKQEEDSENDELSLTEIDKVDWGVPEILKTLAFWKLTLISGSMLGVTLGFLANLGLHAKDLGFAGQEVAILYSIMAFCSMAGKVLVGHLIDRIGLKISGLMTVLVMSLGLFALSLSSQWHFMAASCFIIGCGISGVSPMWTSMIARTFGAKSFGRAMGLMNPAHIPLTGASAPMAAAVSTSTGSYNTVFMIYIVVLVLAGIVLCTMKPPVPGKADTVEQ